MQLSHLKSSVHGGLTQRRCCALALAVAALAFAACGDGSSTANDAAGGEAPSPPVTAGPTSAVGPGITIAEAIAANSPELLLVNGAIVATESETRLCAALLESYPPQCGGDSLRVNGLDLTTLEGLSSAGGVTWADQPVQILGVVRDGVITVSTTVIG